MGMKPSSNKSSAKSKSSSASSDLATKTSSQERVIGIVGSSGSILYNCIDTIASGLGWCFEKPRLTRWNDPHHFEEVESSNQPDPSSVPMWVVVDTKNIKRH